MNEQPVRTETTLKWRHMNINDEVRVRLTTIGVVAYMQQQLHLNARLPPSVKPFPLQPELDGEGYYRTQLWRLMERFGHLWCTGAEPPFHTEFEVQR